jgi:5'-3' exonuclease
MWLQALKAAHVPFLVAPYEADAQMAYMARTGIAELVITEDSDLLAYGAPEVLFKLNRGGECDHLRLSELPMNRNPSFAGLDHHNFIEVREKFLRLGCKMQFLQPSCTIHPAYIYAMLACSLGHGHATQCFCLLHA